MHNAAIVLALCTLSQAVTVIPPSLVFPKKYNGPPAAHSLPELLSGTTRLTNGKSIQVVLSSFNSNLNATEELRASRDSLMESVVEAWAGHQHLVVRPETVWFSVLVQMNYYMTAHADDPQVRNTFVAHTGKKEINIQGTTLANIIPQFQNEIQKRVKTPWLLDWIQPKFSTSTAVDDVTANVMFMGLMQAYFSYTATIVCGIPSITLLGTKADWQRLEKKLDRFSVFGAEPKEFARILRPLFSRFVRTFDAPESLEIRQFWSNIVRLTQYSAPGPVCGRPELRTRADGWITGFQFWNTAGRRLVSSRMKADQEAITYDGVAYTALDTNQLTGVYASVPMKVVDGRFSYNSTLVAGLLARKVTKGEPDGFSAGLKAVGLQYPPTFRALDHFALHPLSGWYMYRDMPSGVKLQGYNDQSVFSKAATMCPAPNASSRAS